MILVKTKVKRSPIHGLGLFADQDIRNGEVIWKFQPGFDQTFTKEQIEQFSPAVQMFLATYAYLSKRTHRYRLDSDNGRYFNHSNTPNTSTQPASDNEEDVIYANRDIRAGEEITNDYGAQEEDHAEGNILETFYKKYNLTDEVDPRLKSEFVKS